MVSPALEQRVLLRVHRVGREGPADDFGIEFFGAGKIVRHLIVPDEFAEHVRLSRVGHVFSSFSLARPPVCHLRDVELLHAHDRPHDAIGALSVAAQKLWQDTRNDLPGDAEFVGEPAALDVLAALRKLLPQGVDLSLVVAIDHERERRREFVMRAAVQRQETLAIDLEDRSSSLSPFRSGANSP